MGSSSSKSSNNCDSYKNQMNSWKNKYYSMKNDRDALAKKNQSLNTEYNLLKESCGSGGSAKQKASQLFNLLQNRYLDRITLLSTQQKVLQKQNTVLSEKQREIDKNTKLVSEYNDKIATSKRLTKHNLDYNKTKESILSYVKLIFILLCISLIIIIVMQMRKK